MIIELFRRLTDKFIAFKTIAQDLQVGPEMRRALGEVEEALVDKVERAANEFVEGVPEERRVVSGGMAKWLEASAGAEDLHLAMLQRQELVEAILREPEGNPREFFMSRVPLSGWYSLDRKQYDMLFDAGSDPMPHFEGARVLRNRELELVGLENEPLFLLEEDGVIKALYSAQKASKGRKEWEVKEQKRRERLGPSELLSLGRRDMIDAILEKAEGWEKLMELATIEMFTAPVLAELLTRGDIEIRPRAIQALSRLHSRDESWNKLRNERSAQIEQMAHEQAVLKAYGGATDTVKMLSLTHGAGEDQVPDKRAKVRVDRGR